MASYLYKHECDAVASTLQRMLETGYVPSQEEMQSMRNCRNSFMVRAVAGGMLCMGTGIGVSMRTKSRGTTLLSLGAALCLSSECSAVAARSAVPSCIDRVLSLEDSVLADETRVVLQRFAPSCASLSRHPSPVDIATGEPRALRRFEEQVDREPYSNPVTRFAGARTQHQQQTGAEDELPTTTESAQSVDDASPSENIEASTVDTDFSQGEEDSHIRDQPQRKREIEERRRRSAMRRELRYGSNSASASGGSF